MKQSEFQLNTSRGDKLFARTWETERNVLGVICLVHGLGEHSGRYNAVAEKFTNAGYSVTSFDQRGHGRTVGKRGCIPSYDAVMDDITCLISDAVEKYPSKPCFLYGHSLGGNLVLNYTLRRQNKLSGVIATSPWLRLASEPSKFVIRSLGILDTVWPSFCQSNGLNAKDLSHNTGVSDSYEKDSYNHDRISARLANSAYNAGLWAIEHAGEFPVPLLIMHGTADRMTSCEGSKEFAARVKTDCTLKLWDDLYHELHNEPEKDRIIAFTIDWINKHSEIGHTA